MNQILVTGNINKSNNNTQANPTNSDLQYNNIDNQQEKNNFASIDYAPIQESNNNYTASFNIDDKTSYNYNEIGKADTSLIVRIFAITIIVFGILLSGNGVLAISKNNKENASKKEPAATITRIGNVLNLSIVSDIPLRSIGYAWNNDEMHYVSAMEKTEVEIPINVIDGENNKLNIEVVDKSNKRTYYKEKYSKAPDTIDPEITISNADPKIKITVTDDTALDHVIYKYGDNQEETVYADPSNPTLIEIEIDNIETTQQTLIVEAVDASQNSSQKTQEVKGTIKPVIKMEPTEEDPSIVVISITCEDNLQKIVIYLGEQRYSTPDNVSIDKKQFTQKVKVESGTTIKVQAYNVSEQMTELTRTIT